MIDPATYVHLMTLAMLGRTAEHLREAHQILPDPTDRRANAAAHLEAHRLPSEGEQP